MRRLAVAALLAGTALLAAVPATPASACDPNQDPRCVSACASVRGLWQTLDRYLAHPPPRPVC
jgi:hypothetical protein